MPTPPLRCKTPMILVLLVAAAAAQDGLPEGPSWGRPRMIRPEAANVLFATGDGCGGCHSVGRNASAMRDVTGGDISPHGLWEATMMANSFRDPFWRSQVAREIAAAPEQAAEIQQLCVTCHAPMAHHTARIAGEKTPPVRDLAHDALARDGVSCTVCHQARPDNFGKPESFAGKLDIRPGREIYGPYPDPLPGPMNVHSAFMPTHGEHISRSALCGSCHTLMTRPAPDAPLFPEQTPYLEWRNSIFSDEEKRTSTSKSCQECHMPDLGSVAIARNPGGGEFTIDPRPNYRGHAFVGGNALMLEILRDGAKEFGVKAPAEAFDRMIAATRLQLTQRTADLRVFGLKRDGDRLRFDVRVVNKTGHKLPTGYPSRRLWLRATVEVDGETVFESGSVEVSGRITGLPDAASRGHVDVVRKPTDVPVWEAIPVDLAGKPTTLLHAMAKYRKDTRLLPHGWRADGPDAEWTGPVGTDGDDDFSAGSDVVHYDVAVPSSGTVEVSVALLYQTIPPEWVEGHRHGKAPENELFIRHFDAANTIAEVLGSTTANL